MRSSMTVDITRMSRNGQVVIPKEIRDRLGLQPGEALIASDVEGRIVLAPARSESLRAEFESIMKEFDAALEGLGPIDPVELVRRVREERSRGA